MIPEWIEPGPVAGGIAVVLAGAAPPAAVLWWRIHRLRPRSGGGERAQAAAGGAIVVFVAVACTVVAAFTCAAIPLADGACRDGAPLTFAREVALVAAGGWGVLLGIGLRARALRAYRRRHVLNALAQQEAVSRRALVARLAEAERIAFQDPLTGLANRRRFDHELAEMNPPTSAARQRYAVLLLDFDNFKQVNDCHGHAVGDLFLKAAANRMRTMLRSGDLLARFGGDEFAVLIVGDASEKVALSFCSRFVAGMSEPLDLGGIAVSPSASIGIALGVTGRGAGRDVLRAADLAMFRAKRSGGAQFAIAPEDAAVEARHLLAVRRGTDLPRRPSRVVSSEDKGAAG